MSGYTMTQGEELYSLPAAVSRSNYVTATQAVMSALVSTSVPRCVIPAGYFNTPGKTLKVKAAGTIANAATTATFIYAAGLDAAAGTIAGAGGGTLFTSPAQAPTASQTNLWDLDLDITCQAVGSLGTTLQVNGGLRESVVATSVWSTAGRLMMFSNNLTGLNNEAALYLELFGTFTGTLTSGDITVLQQLKVYGEN
jgi:hypothetical protein